MKYIAAFVIMLAAAAAVWFFIAGEPGPAKAYRHYKDSILEPQKQSVKNAQNNLVKWEIDIKNVRISGDTATVTATETQYRMPENAAAMNFATIITMENTAELIKEEDGWRVVSEFEMNRMVSEYDDRKK